MLYTYNLMYMFITAKCLIIRETIQCTVLLILTSTHRGSDMVSSMLFNVV